MTPDGPDASRDGAADEGGDGDEGARATDGEELSDDAPGPRPECPFCGSTDVERESAFGSEVSQTQYYCNGCRTVFERLKFDGQQPDTGR